MLSQTKPGHTFVGYDHVTLWVGNAKQAATYYCTRFGFEPLGYRGLETGHRQVASHVVKQGNVVLVLQSALEPDREMGSQLDLHGDFVKDVALTVDSVAAVHAFAVGRGAVSVREPWTEEDAFGSVTMATVKAFGDVTHTFVERQRYGGPFLPNFRPCEGDPISKLLPPTGLLAMDHCVGNQPMGGLEEAHAFYQDCLDFTRFWNVDDSLLSSESSQLRIKALTSRTGDIKLSLSEPAPGQLRSQNQEFVDYFRGPGIHHVALSSADIVASVASLTARGVRFLRVPATYYEDLRVRLHRAGLTLAEDIAALQQLNILVDHDDSGYLLQLFAAPCQDRPTHFIEIIQRHNFSGYGAGNFKALFQAIEREQAQRGNL